MSPRFSRETRPVAANFRRSFVISLGLLRVYLCALEQCFCFLPGGPSRLETYRQFRTLPRGSRGRGSISARVTGLNWIGGMQFDFFAVAH